MKGKGGGFSRATYTTLKTNFFFQGDEKPLEDAEQRGMKWPPLDVTKDMLATLLKINYREAESGRLARRLLQECG